MQYKNLENYAAPMTLKLPAN